MKTRLPILLSVCAALVGLGAGAQAGDPAAARTTGQVLILDNERILEGDIAREGDQYRVRRSVGETWLPEDQVLCLCANMEEAYAYLRQRANLRDPDERLRLARWCQLQGLRAQALAEVSAAVELRPRHEESLRLLHHLQMSSQPPAPTLPSPAGKPDPLAVLPEVEVNADSLGMFVTRVQPILMNTCAHCHATGRGGAFQLLRTYEANTANHRTTQHNLAAVLAQIQRGSPPGSLLLTKAVSIHGGAEQAPLNSRQSPAYRTLEEWVRMALAGAGPVEGMSPLATLPEPERKAGSETAASEGPAPPPGPSKKTTASGPKVEGKRQQPGSLEQWGVANGEGKGDATGPSSSAAAAPEPAVPAPSQRSALPVDPYDPRFFNQPGNPSPGLGN